MQAAATDGNTSADTVGGAPHPTDLIQKASLALISQVRPCCLVLLSRSVL